MNPPLLSIVVPNFNGERYLLPCLESLAASRSPRVEFIFADGGSSDGSNAIVDRFPSLFTHRISERDRGQSDALNKGFRLATGRYLTWLNSDDMLVYGALEPVLDVLERGDADWYAVNQVTIAPDGTVRKFQASGAFESLLCRYGVLHVFALSTILSREMYERVGPFDEGYAYCMDMDYWFRAVRAGYRYHRIQEFLFGFRMHMDSKTSRSRLGQPRPPRHVEEVRRLHDAYYPWCRDWQRSAAQLAGRLWRTLCFHYPRSLALTVRHHGRELSLLRSGRDF